MDKLIVGNDIYEYYEYQYEDNFEKKIVSQSKNIFGENSIYIDIKRELGKGFYLFQMVIFLILHFLKTLHCF